VDALLRNGGKDAKLHSRRVFSYGSLLVLTSNRGLIGDPSTATSHKHLGIGDLYFILTMKNKSTATPNPTTAMIEASKKPKPTAKSIQEVAFLRCCRSTLLLLRIRIAPILSWCRTSHLTLVLFIV